MLAAAHETGVITALGASTPHWRAGGSSARTCHPGHPPPVPLDPPLSRRVGLRRPWELRGYTGEALAFLTGRRRAYGYCQSERFLAQVARAGGDETLTDALAKWAALCGRRECRRRDQPPPAFYLDGHKKPVYTDHLIPRGLVGRTGKVLGCRALLLLHDAKGHPLFATTHRGDLHLTKGAPAFLERYEQATESSILTRLIIDREGMAAEFLAAFVAQGRTVVTILRSNQYQGLSSFTEVGDFVPLCRDRAGVVTREVASAEFALPLPDHPDQTLKLAVALIRDWRTQVPAVPAKAEPTDLERWDADLEGASWHWWRPDWVATPTPAAPTEPKLIPIVTTADAVDPVELVQVYTHRWPAQENNLRDFLLSLGLDTNHGYAKFQVENSEVAKRRAVLERKLAKAGARRKRHESAASEPKRAPAHLEKRLKAQRAEATRTLAERIQAWEQQGVWAFLLREKREAFQQEAAAKLAPLQQRKRKAEDAIVAAFAACERACQHERDLLRQLEDLAASERAMYELDHAKDQVMTVLKLALVNVVMWTRDRYFPATYAQATWRRLAPFFRLPGRIVWGRDTRAGGAASVQ